MDDPYSLNGVLQSIKKLKDEENAAYCRRVRSASEKLKEIEGFFIKGTGRLTGFECETSVPEENDGSTVVRLAVWKLVPNSSGNGDVRDPHSQYGLLAQADGQCKQIEFYFSNGSPVQRAETLRSLEVKDINELRIKEVLVDFVTRVGELVY
ncbi:MAG TPA: hypothetical protein VFH31_15515 [Pyrinomonadaceae bacterium]|nr:hypothetical protein [Pyrinomonadaceae bacterium]